MRAFRLSTTISASVLFAACLAVPPEGHAPGVDHRSAQDAGSAPDGGVAPDSGSPEDGGFPDGGDDVDGGGTGDAGVGDAGTDAGAEPFIDGGPPPVCDDPALHNGGDGVCVPVGTCSADFYLRSDGFCTPFRQAGDYPSFSRLIPLLAHGHDVYALGGHGSFKATVTPDDDLTPWEPIAPFPDDRDLPIVALSGDRIFVVGGYLEDADFNLSDAPDGFYADVGADGSLSDWTEFSGPLAVPRAAGVGLVADGLLWVFGGEATDFNGDYVSIEAAPIDGDGVPGAFELVGVLPGTAFNSRIAASPDTVAIMGVAGALAHSWMYRAPVGSLADQWSSVGPGDIHRSNLCGVVLDDRAVLMGGFHGPEPSVGSGDTIFAADLTAPPVANPWQQIGVLAVPKESAGCVLAGDVVLIVGSVRNLSDQSTWMAKASALRVAVGGL